MFRKSQKRTIVGKKNPSKKNTLQSIPSTVFSITTNLELNSDSLYFVLKSQCRLLLREYVALVTKGTSRWMTFLSKTTIVQQQVRTDHVFFVYKELRYIFGTVLISAIPLFRLIC